MKSRKLFLLVLLFFPLAFGFASKAEKDFIKGSISEKIALIPTLNSTDLLKVAQKGLDFSIENAATLEYDEELSALALACVNAFPTEESKLRQFNEEQSLKITEKFIAIFRLFKNRDLRLAIMEKLPAYSQKNKRLVMTFLNDYLATAFKSNEDGNNVLESAITLLGEVGDKESLSIVFNIWQKKIWPEYKAAIDKSLILLSQDSFSDVIRIFSACTIDDSAYYFTLLKKSETISKNFLCQVAETALLIIINNAENLKIKDKNARSSLTSFQIEAQSFLAENKWSHAAPVVNSNVLLAKKAYDQKMMSEKEFVTIISTAVQIPSSQLAQSLTDILSDCNKKAESSSSKADEDGFPAKSVVLALISALGVLGDKTAFDTLLYVTYCSYPIDVVDEAKKSLSMLQW